MSLRTDLIVKKYKLNRNTDVTVKSKRIRGSDVYSNTFTVEYSTADTTPLTFPTLPALAEYVQKIDLEDDQQELNFGQNDE